MPCLSPRTVALASIFCFLLAADTALAQRMRLRGQIYLPNGQPIGAVTRLLLTSEDPRRIPEHHFTDSQGRFHLQDLAAGQWYAITVESDGERYGTTVERFIAGPGPTGRLEIHLRPLEEAKAQTSVPTVSAQRLAHQPPQDARKLYQQALRAIEKQQPEQAKQQLGRAIELDPGYVSAYNELAVLLLGEKNYAEAESLLRRALENDPEAPYPLLNLGITLNYLGRYSEAREPLQKVLKLRPQWLATHAYLGIALLETGQVTEAEAHLVRATRADGREQALAYLYLGKLYAQSGEVEKAVAAWNSYLEKDPDSPNARLVRELLTQLGHPPQKP